MSETPLGGDWSGDGPEFTADVRDGEIVVKVKRRAGLSDTEITRAALRQAGVIAPVRFDHGDEADRTFVESTHAYHNDMEIIVPLRRGRTVRMMFASDLDTVRTVLTADEADEDQRASFARRNPRHAEWVEKGGDLIAVDFTDGTTFVFPAYYGYRRGSHSRIWIIPAHDHWARCNACRQPWPCVTHRRDADDYMSTSTRLASCHRCGRTDGNHFVFKTADGFPERRSYHTRKGACLNEAKRWAEEHGWMLHENGTGRNVWRTFKPKPETQDNKSVDGTDPLGVR